MNRKEILKLAAKIETSSVRLFGERVALVREEAPEKKGSIYIPETTQKFHAPKRGTVVAVGSGVAKMPEALDIRPGDQITFVQPNASEHTLVIDGEEITLTMIHALDVYWLWRA